MIKNRHYGTKAFHVEIFVLGIEPTNLIGQVTCFLWEKIDKCLRPRIRSRIDLTSAEEKTKIEIEAN